MRLADAIGLRIGGKDAIEAKLNGQVVWTPPVSDPLIALRDAAFANSPRGFFWLQQPAFEGVQIAFQDSAGTTPANADGDPVGLMLDCGPNGHDRLQPVSVRRPILRTNGNIWWLDYSGDKFLYTTATAAIPSNAGGFMNVQASRNLVKTNQYNVGAGRRVFSIALSSTTDYSFSVQRPETYNGDYIVNVSSNVADHVFSARWLGQDTPSQARFNRGTWLSAPAPTPAVGTVSEPIESGSYRALEGTATSYSNGRLYGQLCTSEYSEEIQQMAEEVFADQYGIAL